MRVPHADRCVRAPRRTAHLSHCAQPPDSARPRTGADMPDGMALEVAVRVTPEARGVNVGEHRADLRGREGRRREEGQMCVSTQTSTTAAARIAPCRPCTAFQHMATSHGARLMASCACATARAVGCCARPRRAGLGASVRSEILACLLDATHASVMTSTATRTPTSDW
jgi:hypothetical protein